MVAEKCPPALRRQTAPLHLILRDRRLRYVDAEFEQLPVNARRAPGRVINTHFPNKVAYLCRYIWSPSKARASRVPKQAEPTYASGLTAR